MKKRSMVLKSMICFMFGLASLLLFACGAPKAESLDYVSGLPDHVRQADEIDLTNLKLKVNYSDGTSKEIGVAEIKFTFSSTSLGLQNLVITYTENKQTVKLTLQVPVISQTAIAGVNAAAFEGNYDGNQHGVDVSGTIEGDIVSYSTNNGATFSTTAPTFKNAGEYNVKVKIERTNFDDLILDKTVKINKKGLTITAKSYHIAYGDEKPELEVEFAGFIDGEDKRILSNQPTVSSSYTTISDVGEYDVVVNDENVQATNYAITTTNGKLIVAKKELTVTSSTHNVSYGDDVPVFTYEITGFVNGQNKSVLTTQPQINCNYTKTSDVGSYETIASGADAKNYTFNYVNGNVKVSARVVDVVWSSSNVEYTGEPVAPTAKFVDVNGSDVDLRVNITSNGVERGSENVAQAVLADNNYQLNADTVTKTYSIIKATNNWLVAPSLKDVAYGTDYKPVATPKIGVVKFEYKFQSADDSTYSTTKPTEIGLYTVRIGVEGTDDYDGLSAVSVNFKIYDINSMANVTAFSSKLLAERNTNASNFINKKSTLIAGNQNKFDLQILAEVQGSPDTVRQIDTQIDIKLWDEAESVYKSIENVADYATITNLFNYINFTSNAVNKTFKITAHPKNIADGADIDDLVFEVKVVDGYNVYTADELSVMVNQYNYVSGNVSNGWQEFKQAKGLAGVVANAVVLQNNITINNENIPSFYFWSQAEYDKISDSIKALTNQNIVGSLKDNYEFYIYERDLTANENFGFYGNYFRIDYSNLAKMVLDVKAGNGRTDGAGVKYIAEADENNTQITGHTSIFKFKGVGKTCNLTIQDMSVFGNGKRSADTRDSGGALLAKIQGVTSIVKNNSYSNCYIGFMFETSESSDIEQGLTSKLIDTTGYNSYNTLLYVYGVKDLLIEGGEYIGAGGPVMIVDHVAPKNGGFPSMVNVIGTKLESFVTGNEPWFVSYGATALVPQIKAANAIYTAVGSTFLQKQKDYANKDISGMMNLKVVYKSSSAEGLTPEVVKGEVNYYNTREEYEKKAGYGLNMTTCSAQAVAVNQNLLQNSYTGAIYGMVEDASFATVADTGVTNLNIFINNGMGIMLELYKSSAVEL